MEKIFNIPQKDLSVYHMILKVQDKGLNQLKAAELLGVSDRHFRRLLKAYREEGPAGFLHKRRGKTKN